MLILGRRVVSIMVSYAITLHLVWAGILATDYEVTNATALNALARFIHPEPVLIGVLVTAALLAVWGMMTRYPWVVLLLMPQQVLLMMSAAGAFEAIWIAQFADGVVRSREFIAVDQIYSILAAVGHTVAITVHARRLVSARW